MRLAVYRTDAFVPSQDMRREMFGGIVSVTFHVADVAADIVSRHATAALQLRVLDAGELLYDSAMLPPSPKAFQVATP